MIHQPHWFRDDQVFVSFAGTVGINKDGNPLYTVNQDTGRRSTKIDDSVAVDVEALIEGTDPPHGVWVDVTDFTFGVPRYYESQRYEDALEKLISHEEHRGLELCTIGELVDRGEIVVRGGHGSPSADLRDGDIPYIKVSDIRAGQVNINPTNMVSRSVAERFWGGESSGISPYDLVTPIRASKNIGEFAIVMPGQQEVVFTKEVLILRPDLRSTVDSFYLMWAMSLNAVRQQWDRVIFMQTNREDVGSRYLEIRIPWPNSRKVADTLSRPFREYYQGIHSLRQGFISSISAGKIHHVFLGGD